MTDQKRPRMERPDDEEDPKRPRMERPDDEELLCFGTQIETRIMTGPKRPWLERPDDEELHYFGFLSRMWTLDRGFVPASESTIEYGLQKVQEYQDCKDLEEARKRLVKLVQMTWNDTRVLLRCVDFELADDRKRAAEGYLSRLIFLEPANGEHKRKRLELLDEVDKQDDRLLSEIDNLTTEYQRSISPALLLEWKASVFHARIYNTVAIEGNTLSLEEVGEITQRDNDRAFRVALNGRSFEEMERMHKEVHGMMDVIKHVAGKLFQPKDLFNKKDLLQMHGILLRDQPNKSPGTWRTVPVWFNRYPLEPVAHDRLEAEMDKFCAFVRQQVQSVQANNMHAVELAALVHYYFVHIHPFCDGNGRMGRLLLNIVLEAFGLPLIIVKLEERDDYMEAIKAANFGDMRPLLRLVCKYVRETLESKR